MPSRLDSSGEPITAIKMCVMSCHPSLGPWILLKKKGKERQRRPEGRMGVKALRVLALRPPGRALLDSGRRRGWRKARVQTEVRGVRSLSPHQVGKVHKLPRWFTDGMTFLALEGPRDHRAPRQSVGWACGDTWFPSWVLSPTHSPCAPRESESPDHPGGLQDHH